MAFRSLPSVFISVNMSHLYISRSFFFKIKSSQHFNKKKKKKKKKTDGTAASYISRNQLLQLCTARTAWSDSVNRSASSDSVTKLVSVLFGKCTIYALVVTKC